MSIRSVIIGTAAALVLAVGALTPGAVRVAAAAGDPYESLSSYTVDPERHLVDVVVDLVPAAARLLLDGPGSDRQFHVPAEQVKAWVADAAVATKATLAGVDLAWAPEPVLAPQPLGYHPILIDVPAYRARSIRHVRLSFTIPGAAIRADQPTRVLPDYVHLCVHGNGPLDARVLVRAPASYTLDQFDGPAPFYDSVSGGDLVLDSGSLGAPDGWGRCLSLVDAAQDHVATVVTGGGSVTLRAWPGDTAWQTRVTASIENAVPALVALIGRPIPRVAGLVIREAVVASGYEGQYGFDENAIVLSETVATDSVTDGSTTVAHELAHAWFTRATTGAVWISEGTAEWAARSAIRGATPCVAPPTAGTTTLSSWRYLTTGATSAQLQAVWDEYDTACAIVTQVARAAGPSGMRQAIAALLDKRDPYGAARPVGRTAVSWRDWLDAMDELGIAPGGGPETLASSLLLQYGATTDAAELAARQAARRDYHALIRHAAPWTVPTAVRDRLSGWDFPGAERAIATAARAYDAVAQADVLVPGSHATAGPIEIQWESAQSQADLDMVLALATAQRDAAKDVAAAMAPLQSPLGFVPWLGSLGSSSTTLADAQAAVGADNPAAAEAAAIALRAELVRYESLGSRRLAVGALTVLGLALLLGLVLVRRAARGGARPAAAAWTGDAAGTVLPSASEQAEPADDVRRPRRLPPAPPAWFASLRALHEAPPPVPSLVDARPLLPPMTSPPPGVPDVADAERVPLDEASTHPPDAPRPAPSPPATP